MEENGGNVSDQNYFDSFMFSGWERKSKLDRDEGEKTTPALYLDEDLPSRGDSNHYATSIKPENGSLNQSGNSDICSADGFLIEVTIEEEPQENNKKQCDSLSLAHTQTSSPVEVKVDSGERVGIEVRQCDPESSEEDDVVPLDRKWCSRTTTREHILLQQGFGFSSLEDDDDDDDDDEPVSKKKKRTKQTKSSKSNTKKLSTSSEALGPRSACHGSYTRKAGYNDFDPMEMTLKKLMRLTSNKDATIDWLMRYQYLPGERRCPKCYKKMELQVVPKTVTSDERKWRCRTSVPLKHDTRISIRHGTWFANSNLTLGEILEITYLWTLGLTQGQIQREMGTSSATNVDWANFCREVCEEKLLRDTKAGNRIGGNGVVVELDEWKLATRKNNKGRHGWVIAGRERDDKQKCFMVTLSDQSSDGVLDSIEMYIAPGSYIHTECWRARDRLDESAFHYLTSHHQITFFNPDGQKSKNSVQMAGFGVRQKYLSGYLAVMIWRQRNEGQNLFAVFMRDTSMLYDGICDQASCANCIRPTCSIMTA